MRLPCIIHSLQEVSQAEIKRVKLFAYNLQKRIFAAR